jgi:hypothetical protein
VALHTALEIGEEEACQLGFAFSALKPVSVTALVRRVAAVIGGRA